MDHELSNCVERIVRKHVVEIIKEVDQQNQLVEDERVYARAGHTQLHADVVELMWIAVLRAWCQLHDDCLTDLLGDVSNYEDYNKQIINIIAPNG